MKIAVIGARGRMGQAVSQAVMHAPDLELVAQLDVGDSISVDTLQGAEIAIEFTVPTVSDNNVHKLLDAGLHVVVGTSGWNEERLEKVATHAQRAQRGVLIAPNYSISAILAMEFAQKAARYFTSAEIIELHHPDKVDAPSSTAHNTAHLISQARKGAHLSDMPDATATDPLGARGAKIAGVNVHAIRMRGLYAHEEILFGNTGEQLSIRQDSFTQDSFIPGILLAIRNIKNYSGLIYGLDKFLEI